MERIPAIPIATICLLAFVTFVTVLPGAEIPVYGTACIAYLALVVRASVSQHSKMLGECTTRGPTDEAKVALTFDDGPNDHTTAKLLDLLADRKARATFFCIGRHVADHPDIARRIHEEGHALGNHSYTHTPWTALSPFGLRADLARSQETIEAATGSRPRFFRPPYGIRNHQTAAAAARNELRVVGWSCGGGDTSSRPAQAIVDRITGKLAPGSIILLHDHGPHALEVTGKVLDACEARGLQPVRLDELLG